MGSVVRTVIYGVRESVTLGKVGGWVALALGLRYVLDEPWADVVWFLVLVAIVGGFFALSDGVGVDERYRSGIIGLVLMALGAGAATVDGSWLLGAVAVAVGAWFTLDALGAVRSGRSLSTEARDADDELSATEAMFRMQVLNRVVQELREGPRTPAEIASACGLTESRTHDALDRLESMGRVDAINGTDDQCRWALDESEFGVLAFVRGIVTTVLSRALLPVRELARRA